MKIESIIKRNPPTSITLGDTAYQFEPDSEGRHVCEVTDQQHLARLLSIPEGYRLVLDGPHQPAPHQPQQPTLQPSQPTFQPTDDDDGEEGEDELKGSAVHPVEIDLGDGKTILRDEAVKLAFEQSGMTREEWNEQDEDDRYAKIDAVLDAMVAPEQEDTDGKDGGDTANQDGAKDDQKLDGDLNGDGDLDREELAKLYEAKFGKRPHGKWTADRISEELKKDAE